MSYGYTIPFMAFTEGDDESDFEDWPGGYGDFRVQDTDSGSLGGGVARLEYREFGGTVISTVDSTGFGGLKAETSVAGVCPFFLGPCQIRVALASTTGTPACQVGVVPYPPGVV